MYIEEKDGSIRCHRNPKISAEFQTPISVDIRQKRINEYKKAMSLYEDGYVDIKCNKVEKCYHFCCASCGEQELTSKKNKIFVKDMSIFLFNLSDNLSVEYELFIFEEGTKKGKELYYDKNLCRTYCLISKFVEICDGSSNSEVFGESYAHICNTCEKRIIEFNKLNNDKPNTSQKEKILSTPRSNFFIRDSDYGNLLWIEKQGTECGIQNCLNLSAIEKAILQFSRMYCEILKLVAPKANADSYSALKGHFITFVSDAPFEFLSGIKNLKEKINKTISVLFVGTKYQWQLVNSELKTGKKYNRLLGVDGRKVLFWLHLLKNILKNPYYQEFELPTDDAEVNAQIKLFESIREDMIDNAVIESDEKIIDFESKIGADVANVRCNNNNNESNNNKNNENNNNNNNVNNINNNNNNNNNNNHTYNNNNINYNENNNNNIDNNYYNNNDTKNDCELIADAVLVTKQFETDSNHRFSELLNNL
jgi:hypothetical protein